MRVRSPTARFEDPLAAQGAAGQTPFCSQEWTHGGLDHTMEG